MKYSRFETLAFVLGTIAVIASVLMAPTATPQAAEVAAQLLIIVVLAGALHWGRNGGFLAALVAIAVYVAMRFSLLQSEGLSADLLTMLGARAITYAVIGIIGGELASRIKYLFAKLESDTLVDHGTGVYSARFAASGILSGVGQWDRYQTEYSIVRISIDPEVYAALKASRCRQIMRQIAAYLRNDVRMVDDIAVESTGTFLVLLPGTDAPGAAVVSDRLSAGVREMLGSKDSLVVASVLSAATDSQALKNLADSLSPDAQYVPARPLETV